MGTPGPDLPTQQVERFHGYDATDYTGAASLHLLDASMTPVGSEQEDIFHGMEMTVPVITTKPLKPIVGAFSCLIDPFPLETGAC